MTDIKYEDCVSCGTTTNVPVNQNVDHRAHYVEGAGQLCPKCYSDTYGPRRAEEARS
jgi:recombinational DNA repair protein (RecF pathway)